MGQEEIPVHINFVLNRSNLADVEAMAELAEKYSVVQLNFLPFVAKGIGRDFKEGTLTSLEMFRGIEKINAAGSNGRRNLLTGTMADILVREAETGQGTCECVAGYKGLYYVTPQLEVFSCPNLMDPKFSVGNLSEVSLREIHHKRIGDLYRRLPKLETDASDYTCKGAVDFYRRTGQLEMVESSKSYNRYLNMRIQKTTLKEYDASMAYCFSRNI